MATLLSITVGVIVYGFWGSFSTIIIQKKLYDKTDLDEGDSMVWAVLFSLVWPLAGASMLTWNYANKTALALSTRKAQKQLAPAKVVKE